MRFPRPGPGAIGGAALWSALLDLALGVLVLVAAVDAWAPPQDLPWEPLRIADPIGAATGVKLARLAERPDACRAVLREGGIRTRPAPDRDDGDFCVVADAVRLTGGATPLSPGGLTLSCPLTVSYAIWDRQVLQPAARDVFGRGVAQVETYGSYACRRLYGLPGARPSQHARANALDVAGFRLQGGRRVSVAGGWSGRADEAAFLRRIHAGACRAFATALGPGYNAAHRDHFHLDRGRWSLCR